VESKVLSGKQPQGLPACRPKQRVKPGPKKKKTGSLGLQEKLLLKYIVYFQEAKI